MFEWRALPNAPDRWLKPRGKIGLATVLESYHIKSLLAGRSLEKRAQPNAKPIQAPPCQTPPYSLPILTFPRKGAYRLKEGPTLSSFVQSFSYKASSLGMFVVGSGCGEGRLQTPGTARHPKTIPGHPISHPALASSHRSSLLEYSPSAGARRKSAGDR